ncbi:MAG: glycosyltransferase [Eubacteriales bacterium]|nr:glycosyltransferase [Eubacteriales bacterium]
MANLFDKTVTALKQEGIKQTIGKTKKYVAKQIDRQKAKRENCFKDVLFINGCGPEVPHPARYRVTHQREQLSAANISSSEVFYLDLDLKQVRLYRTFVFFRCPCTETIESFIKIAKKLNKTVIFDIDDLVIDTKYTDLIPYLDTMSAEERAAYDAGVNAMKKTLLMSDYAITTTERLAEELSGYVKKVFINRNTASEEMVLLSEQALKEKSVHDKVKIGYFSGSITHNDDVEMLLPVLNQIMEKYEDVELHLVGEITVPDELAAFENRIVFHPFMDWKKLPKLISEVDINLAPLTDTIFNEAKSENKWVEAALVKVPTIASNLGAFARMMEHEKTGLLCLTAEEWLDAIERLITDTALRTKLAENAYRFCKKNCVTFYQSQNLRRILEEIMNPNVMFVLPSLQISGGIRVAMEHMAVLQKKGVDVSIINIIGNDKRKWISYRGAKIPIALYESERMDVSIDKAVATMWSTVQVLEEYANIRQRYYLVQNYETDFYKPCEEFRMRANNSYYPKVPVQFLTISKWCQSWLAESYGHDSGYVENGIEMKRFRECERDFSGKIRILIEGDCSVDYKNVDESFRIVEALDKDKYEIWYMSYNAQPKEWYRVDKFLHKVPFEEVGDVYAQCHILLKTSLLESFSYPPLEMMATGGYNVVILNDGNQEYLRHGENCLTFESGDMKGAVAAIDQIVSDESLREKLRTCGIKTARVRDWKLLEDKIYDLYMEKNQG